MTEKVVKCKKCDLHFGYTIEKAACPFCRAAYAEEIETKENKEEIDMSKVQKKSFKVWKNS